MSAEPVFVRSWPVGRWTATLIVPPIIPGQRGTAAVEWSPALPGRPLTASERAQYQAGRDDAIAELGKLMGLICATLEFGKGLRTPLANAGGGLQ
jgi:hypothetical protein